MLFLILIAAAVGGLAGAALPTTARPWWLRILVVVGSLAVALTVALFLAIDAGWSENATSSIGVALTAPGIVWAARRTSTTDRTS